MVNAEKVVIDIVANDQAGKVFEDLNKKLKSLQKLSDSTTKKLSSAGSKNQNNSTDNNKTYRRVSSALTNINKRISTTTANIQRRNSTVLGNIQRRTFDIESSIQRRTSTVLGNIQRRNSSVLGNIQRRTSTVLGNIQRRIYLALGNVQRRVSTSVSRIQNNTSLTTIQRRVSTVLGAIQRRVSTTQTRIQQRVSTTLTRIYNRTSTTLTNIQRRVSTVLGNIQRKTFSNQSQNNTNILNVLNKINNNVSRIASRTRSSRGGSNYSGNGGRNSATGTIDELNSGVTIARSNFHDLNTLMYSVNGRLSQFSAQIAGIFGAAGIGDMIGKMWDGAAQRQQNMLYLIHQKGVEEANAYYNDIMEIVTELPGDDTFLTNILNMASAMDSSLKIDNLKEAGTAITDYYMAATMKGENAYETQKDIRKFITTGETRGLRNSVLASEIDLLKNKNNVLERTQALEKALENTGFAGMSEYESAANELEEFKGHFQKAFADLGTLITSVVQPLMKFYNTIDSIFGSRVSQLIILASMLLIGFFTIVGGGALLLAVVSQSLEVLGMNLGAYAFIIRNSTSLQGAFNMMLQNSIGIQAFEQIAVDGSVKAGLRNLAVKSKVLIATQLNVAENEREIISIFGLTTASLRYIKTKIVKIATTIRDIIVGVDEVAVTEAKIAVESGFATVLLTETELEEANRIIRVANIRAKIVEKVETIKLIASTIWEVVVKGNLNVITAESTFGKILETIATTGLISVTFTDAGVQILDAEGKEINTIATLGLAVATGILKSMFLEVEIIVWIVVGVIAALIIVVEKVGEAFGWWKDIGSMISAISEGINRLWNAFIGSDVIQGIISYFQKFVGVIQYVFNSIGNMLSLLTGGGNGTFDVVQSIINVFGTLGDVIKWVWNLLDDWSNSPLGIITWLNPLGILIFHLDEIGSLFEDIGDAVNRFVDTSEFQALISAFGEVWTELQEPFQEIWDLVNEIIGLFGELFSDPEGQGTEERINFLVEILKGLATIIRVVVIPAIRGIGLAIRIILTPVRIFLEIVKMIGNLVTQVSNAIKNSFIGKLLGWDKDNNDNNSKYPENPVNRPNNPIGYNQRLTGANVNSVRNLGRTYNSNTNQNQTVIHQHFSEGSMPIDARNMTAKEARKMFVGAFGYNRSVGSKGILR